MTVPNDKRLKKDALWKPLLRHFRQFIRSKLGKYVDINNIFSESGDIKEKALLGCSTFMDELEVPTEIRSAEEKYKLGLIILLAPSQASNLPVFFQRSP
jgi:hypothetical protein